MRGDEREPMEDEEFMAIYRRWMADFWAALDRKEPPPNLRHYLREKMK